jgi:hypothetical protein
MLSTGGVEIGGEKRIELEFKRKIGEGLVLSQYTYVMAKFLHPNPPMKFNW